MANLNEERVAVKIELPRSLDRAVEIEAAKRDITKRQLIENALRAHLKVKADAA